MNNSKYILMCEKAIEIQKEHKWENYDLFWSPEIADNIKEMEKHIEFRFKDTMALGIYLNGTITCDSCNEEIDLYPFDKFFLSSEVVWLPRQNQLQEMVKRKDVATSISALTLWFPICPIDIYLGQSMEQLWLSFIMFEKYQKRWDTKTNNWKESNASND